MKVKEVMATDIKSLSPETSAREALNMLSQMEISGLPVVNADGKLAGMFTEKDILRNILPSYLDKVGMFVYEENPKGIRKKAAELDRIRVKEIMRKDVVAVDEDASLCEVARIMLIHKVRRIPVLNKEKKIVGIVARQDIIGGLFKESGL